MNYLKNLFLAILLIGCSTAYAQSFEKAPPKDGPKQGMEKKRVDWKSELNLDKEQGQLFAATLKTFRQKRGVLRDSGMPREGMRAQMKELAEAENKELKGILDEAQFNRYLEIRKEQRKSRSGKPGPPPERSK